MGEVAMPCYNLGELMMWNWQLTADMVLMLVV